MDTNEKSTKLVEELNANKPESPEKYAFDIENNPEILAPKVINEDNIHLTTGQNSLKRDEKIAILVLFSLYFIQGIPIGFYDEAVPYFLIEKGALYTEMGGFSFVLYPFSLKLLLAPFEDSYYFPKFGKRKSYIIPIQYIMAFSFFILSFFLEELINNKEIAMLTFLGIFLNTLAATQDIAVDGWVLTLLDKSHVMWGSVCQSVGQSLGVIFGSTVFLQLNSLKFCNRFIYSNPSDTALITMKEFLIAISMLILIINMMIHFLINEKPVNEKTRKKVWELLKSLKGFYQNKHLRFLVTVQLLWNIGFATVTATSKIKIMNQGMDKETLTTISSSMISVSLLVSFIVGRIVVQGREMSFFLKVYWLKFLDNLLTFLFILNLTHDNSNRFIPIYILLSILSTVQVTARFVNSGGFNNRISDENMGGTFLTFLNSMDNLGRMWCSSAALFLVALTDYYTIVLIGWIWVFLFFILNYKKIAKLEKLSKEEWGLKYRVE